MSDRAFLVAAFVILMAASFFYPGSGQISEDIITIRNVSSLLFGILAGFFIAFLLNRFATIRSLVTRESTMLMELYKMAQAFGDDFSRKVADKIDSYLLIRFDGDNYFRFTYRARDTLFSIFDDLKSLPKVETQNLTTMHRYFVTSLKETIPLRRETIVTGSITVSFVQWSSLLLLAFILVSTLFHLKTPSFFSSFLTGLLSFAIFLILYITKDLSQLKLGGDMLKYETIERVFECLGKLRYYPVSRIMEGDIPPDIERLRLGMGGKGNYSEKIIEVSREEVYEHAKKYRKGLKLYWGGLWKN